MLKPFYGLNEHYKIFKGTIISIFFDLKNTRKEASIILKALPLVNGREH